MTSALSEITGWQVKRKVPAQMLRKEKFHHYLESRMKDSGSKDDIRAEELTLKMFGFVPQNFDLAKQTVDLVSEQAAAYYDYKKKRLYILDSTADDTEQRVALVHELAHALADQHHPLGKYLKKGDPDDDASTARQAVMEGQATWLTWAYVSKRNGGKGEVPEAMLDELTKAVGADGADFPVYYESASIHARIAGVSLQRGHAISGRRVSQARPRGIRLRCSCALRSSTQQILHPPIILSEDMKPADPDAPALESVVGKKEAKLFRVLAEGTLGEFDFSVLLREYISEKKARRPPAIGAAASYRLYEHKRDKYPVLTYTSNWDSPESAQEFFKLYQRVMKGKWKKMTGVTLNTDGAASVLTGIRRFRPVPFVRFRHDGSIHRGSADGSLSAPKNGFSEVN